VPIMTKIVLKSEAAPIFDFLRTPLRVLFHPAILAYHESRGLIYFPTPKAGWRRPA
jgi:hypothetical protein